MNQVVTMPADDPVFVFDLDGVITNPSDSSVDTKAVGHVHELLEQGSYVAVNTGRSYDWVQQNLLALLQEKGASDTLAHLFIVCEKGGESIKWNGYAFELETSRFALSDDVHDTVRQLFEENKAQLTTMFWDAGKQTMATIEKYPQADLGQFRAEQQLLTPKLQEALAGQDVKIDPTTIATDVESPLAGKHAGAELIYEWVAAHKDGTRNATKREAEQDAAGAKHGAKNAARHTFICFGDSKSDYEMARYFAQKGQGTTFVFVGSKEEVFTEEPGVQLVRTKARYAQGTREYFEG